MHLESENDNRIKRFQNNKTKVNPHKIKAIITNKKRNAILTKYWELVIKLSQAVARGCSVKKVFLDISQNSQENTCARVSFLIKLQVEACNFIKKETLAQVFFCEFYEISKTLPQVFFCEFYEISKNTFSYRTPPVAASEL